jgi:tripartite-type tricarboxylate transporter receptor subunit TctC
LPTLRALIVAALTVALAGTVPAAAATWPTRAVTIVVPYAAGGMADVMARLAAHRLSQ